MPTVVGDKIGLDVPTVGGDTDTWGSTLNTSTFTEVDEMLYAAREDRNIVVTGGGKISWDSGTTQVAFTGNVVIHNHVTANTVSITTAGSPVTLGASGTVGYVKINRKPSSNQSITSVSTAAAGALPNTNSDADSGVFVLFQRTSDTTLWIPWARREILAGDHWQFGAALSWYERIAVSRKPAYRSHISDTSQVVVPGSTAAPAVVTIDGKLYANTSDATMDLDTAGRNGLDTGSKAANTPYYLYAIPAVSGRTFDVVASVTAPSGAGPTGFSSFSYIGAFCTLSGSTAIPPFQASSGIMIADDEIEVESHTGGTSQNAETYGSLPTTAKQAWGIVSISGTVVNVTGRAMGMNTSGNVGTYQQNSVTGIGTYNAGWVSIFTANTIYLQVGNATDTVDFALLGWKEDPMEYK